jgi:UDP-3-O-[3-hydroxymyristoyl] glucosamine N-acyltransferase
MLIYNTDLPLVAISYDTVTFNDLKFYLKHNHSVELTRQDPEEFLKNSTNLSQYINLVIQDFDLRKEINKHLDSNHFDRFTFVHPDSSVQGADIGNGVMIYPGVIIYPDVKIKNDVIVHSATAIGHNTKIESGTYVSGGVIFGGGADIGNNCFIGLRATILDGIKIINDVTVSQGSTIKKDIGLSGVWATISRTKLVKLK